MAVSIASHTHTPQPPPPPHHRPSLPTHQPANRRQQQQHRRQQIKMSHPPGPGGQPYVPTEAEQAEHLRNLASRLKEFWIEQLQEVNRVG